jgi:thiol-disulfide isomerase/thioredoxin
MLRSLTIASALLLVAGCQKPPQQDTQAPQTNEAAAPTEAGPVKGVDRSHKGEAAPAATFDNPDGGAISLAKFKGVPVLVNLWASWCAPCVKELPTLGQLAATNRAIEVVAVSQDNAPEASVDAFLKQHKLGDFAAYRDPKLALGGALGVQIMPTSILFDANGHEVWRYVGDLDWTSPEATKLLDEAGAAPPR